MSDVTTEQENDGEVTEAVETPPNHHINPEVLQNISVAIKVEVGRTKMKIRDLLRLTRAVSLNSSASPASRWICWSTTRSWHKVKWCWSMIATASDSHASCPPATA